MPVPADGGHSCRSDNDDACSSVLQCQESWITIADQNEVYSAASDIRYDAKVNGADLGQLLADCGNAPRQDIPPSDCPLAWINP